MYASGRAIGFCGVALLALTSCHSPDGEPSPDQTAQEESTPEATQDQDDAPEETATVGEQLQPPEIAEIEETVWESATAQESVIITGELSPQVLDWGLWQPEAETDQDPQSSEQDTEVPEPVDVRISGSSAGEGSIYRLGDLLDYTIFGEDVYQSIDSVVAEYEHTQPPEAQVPEGEEIREAFEAEGSWTNWGATGREVAETPAEFIGSFAGSYLDSAQAESLADLQMESELATRDGQEVWVYRAEADQDFLELTVHAEESEPLPVEISYALGPEEADISFSEWNQAEKPQEPEPEEVIESDEVESILQSLG